MNRLSRWIWMPALALIVAGCDSNPTDPALNSLPGDDLGALASEQAALEGAELDQSRSMTPEQLARRWVNHASNLLERATRMAGPNPEPPISSWLQSAEQKLGQALHFLDQGNWHVAIVHAQNSASKSWKVIEALTPQPDISELAAQAIERAGHLLERAKELASQGDPSPEIREALERAKTLLGSARDAYAAGDHREALALARESAALSSRVIRALSTTTVTR